MTGPARLLRHRGHGGLHYDLVLCGGALCPTVALYPGTRGWRWRRQAPHRRRYLGISNAPIDGGRGHVETVWRGTARWHHHPGGLDVILGGRRMQLRPSGVVIPHTPPHLPPWM